MIAHCILIDDPEHGKILLKGSDCIEIEMTKETIAIPISI